MIGCQCFCSLAGKQIALKVSPILFLHLSSYIYIYIYAFSRRFYPKRLTVHSGYTFFISMCVPWELNPQPFALLTQCSTTEPQLWCGMNWLPNRIRTIIIRTLLKSMMCFHINKLSCRNTSVNEAQLFN